MNAWLIVSIVLGIWAVLSVFAYERERRVREMEEREQDEASRTA